MLNQRNDLITIDKLVLEDIVPNLNSIKAYECKIISTFDTFILLDKFKLSKTKPNKGELRLALDMINQRYPLYKKCDHKSKQGFLEDIFNFDLTEEKLNNLKPFKKIVKRELISAKIVKNKTIIKKVNIIRRRKTLKYSNNVKIKYMP